MQQPEEEDREKLLIQLRQDVIEKEKLITSMENTHKTLVELMEDKDTVIETQRALFNILRSQQRPRIHCIVEEHRPCESLEDALAVIAQKDREIQCYKMEVESLKEKMRLLVPEDWL